MIIARHSFISKVPMPYVVDIVDGPSAAVSEVKAAPEDKSPAVEDARSKPSNPRTKDTPKKQDYSRVKESIEALQAKKKIEKMAALRKVVDIKSQASGIERQGAGSRDSKTKNSGGGDYYSMVVGKIRQQWVFPESIDKDLTAVISIKIARDGSVTVDKIEKGSGNPLFDRSALRAISKASPLPPPQQEMEMGVRFKP